LDSLIGRIDHTQSKDKHTDVTVDAALQQIDMMTQCSVFVSMPVSILNLSGMTKGRVGS
jgi:hypothetical protein